MKRITRVEDLLYNNIVIEISKDANSYILESANGEWPTKVALNRSLIVTNSDTEIVIQWPFRGLDGEMEITYQYQPNTQNYRVKTFKAGYND